jgi:hypothetical protein
VGRGLLKFLSGLIMSGDMQIVCLILLTVGKKNADDGSSKYA